MDSGYPLRGRDEELARLTIGLHEVGSGRGTTTVVTGESGIGKSRLVTELMETARRRGHRVFSGVAAEMERERPFGVYIDAFALDRGAADFAAVASLNSRCRSSPIPISRCIGPTGCATVRCLGSFDAPESFWSHDRPTGENFIEARRSSGRPLVDHPWVLPGEFVVGRGGVIAHAHRYQHCEDYPQPLVLQAAIKRA